jgi:hypothetical protein
MQLRWLAPGLAIVVSACATARTLVLDDAERFSDAAAPAEYVPFRSAGSGMIAGKAASPGVRVILDPATSLARRWYAEVGLVPDQFDALPSDTTFRSMRRATLTDSTGSFSFTGLPAGTYIVATLETWDIPNGGFGLRPQSGVVSHVVSLAAAETTRVVFTHRAVGAAR